MAGSRLTDVSRSTAALSNSFALIIYQSFRQGDCDAPLTSISVSAELWGRGHRLLGVMVSSACGQGGWVEVGCGEARAQASFPRAFSLAS